MRTPSRWTIVLATGVVTVTGSVVAAAALQDRDSASLSTHEGLSDSAAARMEVTIVQRRDLIEQESLNATVGYGQSRSLPIDAAGLITWAPDQNTIVNPGEVIVKVDGKPVTLARGTEPLYRELRRVGSNERDQAGDKLGAQSGQDVEQLQQFLIDQGFDDKARLEVDGVLSYSTERAIEAWQQSVGHPATGRVDRSQLVFVDEPVRVEQVNLVGERFSGLTVSGTNVTITVDASAKQRPFFAVDSAVVVELANTTTEGTVTRTTRTLGADGSARHEIEIAVRADMDLGDIEVAKVTATRVVASDVLTVPVRALVALAEGGWAVQLDSETGPKLVGVELGQVVGGMAEISGLEEGTEVVVPI